MNKKIKIQGKVQGVFFRKSAQEKARELDIKGWIRNEPDGSVTTEIEGNREAVLLMENWLRTGPAPAKVEQLIAEEGEDKNFGDFIIER